MSIQQRERTVEVWEGVTIAHDARIRESVLCITTNELTRQELHLIGGDAYILKTIDEASGIAEASYTAVVVFASGLELIRDLLQIDALDGAGRIHWHLDLGLIETLESLARLELPIGASVESINYVSSGTVVTTSLTACGMLDNDSFRRGVQAGGLHTHVHGASSEATALDTERLLRERLLNTLQTMEPLIDSGPSCGRAHDGVAENELILLKRKFDALERKYKSLAASRLGKLTLRLWARKGLGRRGPTATKAW